MKQFTEEQIEAPLPAVTEPPEIRQARELASRYRLPSSIFTAEGESPIDYSLLSELPVDLMVRISSCRCGAKRKTAHRDGRSN